MRDDEEFANQSQQDDAADEILAKISKIDLGNRIIGWRIQHRVLRVRYPLDDVLQALYDVRLPPRSGFNLRLKPGP